MCGGFCGFKRCEDDLIPDPPPEENEEKEKLGKYIFLKAPFERGLIKK